MGCCCEGGRGKCIDKVLDGGSEVVLDVGPEVGPSEPATLLGLLLAVALLLAVELLLLEFSDRGAAVAGGAGVISPAVVNLESSITTFTPLVACCS